MRITTLHEATSVDALVDRMFARLTADDRRKVAAAVVKANPALAGRDRLEPGTVLRIPTVPGVMLAPAAGPWGSADPAGEVRDWVTRAVKEYGAHHARRHALHQEQLKQQGALLGDEKLKAALRGRQDAAQLVPGIEAAIKARTKESAAVHKEVEEAVNKLTETLGSL